MPPMPAHHNQGVDGELAPPSPASTPTSSESALLMDRC